MNKKGIEGLYKLKKRMPNLENFEKKITVCLLLMTVALD